MAETLAETRAGTRVGARGGGPWGSSRREFLRRVGPTGGAGALFATMGALGLAPPRKPPGAHSPVARPGREGDFTLGGRGASRAVVVGGGVAGLTVACHPRSLP